MSARRAVGLLALLGLALACSGGAAPAGPGQTVREFYGYLNDADYAAAMALYNADALDVLDDPSLAEDTSFADWAVLETKDGKVQRVDIVDEQAEATKARVEFEVRYADGTTSRHTVELTLEDGQWRLGLIG